MQGLTRSLLAVVFGILILASMAPLVPKKAYGDGFTMENVQANIGNRVITAFIKLNPPILTSENNGDRYIQFRFFDANTNTTLNNVSFFINATKGNKILMHDLFYTHTGYLTIKFQPGDCHNGVCTVYGDQDPILSGWGSQTSDVTVLSPILEEGGLYHFHMELFAIDYGNTIINQTDPPKFDSYLSVGDISNQSITYQNTQYPTTLISYYDKVSNFNFDQSAKKFTWTMPFDWDVSRFQDRPIFIHEELHVPKAFKDFSNTPTYSANAQGFALTGSRIIVDPYTQGDNMIVHLFLNKFDIENIAKTVPPGTNTMTFSLAPEKPNVQTSSSLLTDFGGWHIKLGWNPTSLAANSQNNLKLTFLDAFTEQQVAGDVNYDIQLQDTSGSTLWSKTGATAKDGVDTQSINLPGNGIYSIVVKINSITPYTGIPDTTRTGMGRGNVVIPSTATADTSVQQNPNDTTSTNQSIVIPAWIKNNAGWWHDGTIDDNTFVQGIQYMITNGIMKVPHSSSSSTTSNTIPAWIKNNAGWWHDGTIDDNTFVQGIQYMITNGIIVLKQ